MRPILAEPLHFLHQPKRPDQDRGFLVADGQAHCLGREFAEERAHVALEVVGMPTGGQARELQEGPAGSNLPLHSKLWRQE